MTWHGTVLYNSYYIVAANSLKEAREKARKRAKENAPNPHSTQLSIRTSFKGFLK